VYPFVLISETILDLGVRDVEEVDVVAGSIFVDVPLTGMPEGFAILQNRRDLGVGLLTVSCSNPQKYNENAVLVDARCCSVANWFAKGKFVRFLGRPCQVKIFFWGRVWCTQVTGCDFPGVRRATKFKFEFLSISRPTSDRNTAKKEE
jgi:hypothetical protein